MRYLVSFACVLAALLAAPLSGSAQDREDAAQDAEAPMQEPGRGVQRWHPDAYVDPAKASDPEFKVEYVPADPYEAADERVRKAKVGVGVSALGVGLGVALAMGGAAAAIGCSLDSSCTNTGVGVGAFALGVTIGSVGAAGMIGSGVALHKRKKERDELRAAYGPKRRKVRWDPARSRFVF